MRTKPITLKEANAFVGKVHRHHGVTRGCKFAVCLESVDGRIVGVAICGRAVSRMVDQRMTLEVTRLATDGTKNACSKLYGACARVAREMGYTKIQTYVLASETGTSLIGSGWVREAEVPGRGWSCPSRGRVDKHPTEAKARWAKLLS